MWSLTWLCLGGPAVAVSSLLAFRAVGNFMGAPQHGFAMEGLVLIGEFVNKATLNMHMQVFV